MRDGQVIGIGSVALGLASVADRFLVAAWLNGGAFMHDRWAQELLLAADRLPKLVALVLLGWIAVAMLRRGLSARVATLMIVVGVALGVVPTLVLATRFEPLVQIAIDLFLPAQFVSWTATGLLVIGLASLVRGLSGLPVIPWIRLVMTVAVLALTWPADALLNELFRGAAAGRTAEAMLAAEMILRTATMAALLTLLALTVRTDRHAAVSALTAVIGAVVFIGFAAIALLGRPWIGVFPTVEDPIVAGYFARWASGGALLLGAWGLLHQRAAKASAPLEPLVAPVHERL